MNLDSVTFTGALLCENNELTSFDFEAPTFTDSFYSIRCRSNNLTALTINNKDIDFLHFMDNNISSLNVSNSTIYNLLCQDNSLLDISITNSEINILNLYNTDFETLYFDEGNSITSIWISNNPNVETIDFSKVSDLNYLTLTNNPLLTYINFQNGYNELINIHNNVFDNSLNIETICVDDTASDFSDEIIAAIGYPITLLDEGCTIGLTENTIENLSLFPNPSANIIHIQAASQVTLVEIYNSLNQKVYSVQSKNNQVDITNLNSGIYTLKIYDTLGRTEIQKIIKK